MNLMVLPPSRVKQALKFNDGYLHFTESRRHLIHSREPHTSLASRSLSEPAKLLIRARQGDIDCHVRLIRHCADIFVNHALKNGWQATRERAEGVCELAAEPFVFGTSCDESDEDEKALSDAESARRLGISHNVFKNKWKTRVLIARQWVELWYREGGSFKAMG